MLFVPFLPLRCWSFWAVFCSACPSPRAGFLSFFSAGGFASFSPFFVALTAIVGFVESGALEDYAGTGADKAFEPAFTTMRTLLQWLGSYGLKLLELIPATLTYVSVGGHSNQSSCVVWSASAASSVTGSSSSACGSVESLLTMTLLGRMVLPLSL